MTRTKHEVIYASKPEEFKRLLDEVGTKYDVFATQTHVTACNGSLVYTATCFRILLPGE
jgi:hypothetical protein